MAKKKSTGPLWEMEVIDMEDVYNPEGQIRDDTTNEMIDEIAESIKEKGMLQPIGVCNSEEVGEIKNKKYHLVWGQKRMKASRIAGNTKINAMVHNMDEIVSEKDIIDLAITENLFRTDMSDREEKESILRSYINHGKNINALVKALPLPEDRIRRAVKEIQFEQIKGATDVRDYVLNETRYRDDLASRIVNTCKIKADETDAEKGIKLAEALSTLEQSEHKKVFEAARLEPDDDVDTWVEDAKRMDFPTGKTITFLESEIGAIEKVCNELGVDFTEFVHDAAISKLTSTDLAEDVESDIE